MPYLIKTLGKGSCIFGGFTFGLLDLILQNKLDKNLKRQSKILSIFKDAGIVQPDWKSLKIFLNSLSSAKEMRILEKKLSDALRNKSISLLREDSEHETLTEALSASFYVFCDLNKLPKEDIFFCHKFIKKKFHKFKNKKGLSYDDKLNALKDWWQNSSLDKRTKRIKRSGKDEFLDAMSKSEEQAGDFEVAPLGKYFVIQIKLAKVNQPLYPLISPSDLQKDNDCDEEMNEIILRHVFNHWDYQIEEDRKFPEYFKKLNLLTHSVPASPRGKISKSLPVLSRTQNEITRAKRNLSLNDISEYPPVFAQIKPTIIPMKGPEYVELEAAFLSSLENKEYDQALKTLFQYHNLPQSILNKNKKQTGKLNLFLAYCQFFKKLNTGTLEDNKKLNEITDRIIIYINGSINISVDEKKLLRNKIKTHYHEDFEVISLLRNINVYKVEFNHKMRWVSRDRKSQLERIEALIDNYNTDPKKSFRLIKNKIDFLKELRVIQKEIEIIQEKKKQYSILSSGKKVYNSLLWQKIENYLEKAEANPVFQSARDEYNCESCLTRGDYKNFLYFIKINKIVKFGVKALVKYLNENELAIDIESVKLLTRRMLYFIAVDCRDTSNNHLKLEMLNAYKQFMLNEFKRQFNIIGDNETDVKMLNTAKASDISLDDAPIQMEEKKKIEFRPLTKTDLEVTEKNTSSKVILKLKESYNHKPQKTLVVQCGHQALNSLRLDLAKVTELEKIGKILECYADNFQYASPDLQAQFKKKREAFNRIMHDLHEFVAESCLIRNSFTHSSRYVRQQNSISLEDPRLRTKCFAH